MTHKVSTKTEFLSLICRFSNEQEPLNSLISVNQPGSIFRNDLNDFGTILVTSGKGKSLNQHIANMNEQLSLLEQQYRTMNAILKAAANAVNTKFVISSSDITFFRKRNASLLLEVWESSDLLVNNFPKSVDSDEDFFSTPGELYGDFRIAGVDLEPDEITDILKIEPTSSFRRGDINPRNNKEYEFGKWSISTEGRIDVSNSSLDDNFRYLLNVLSGQRSNLRRIRELGLDAVFFLFWEAQYFVTRSILSSEIIAELDSYKTDIVFDIYF